MVMKWTQGCCSGRHRDVEVDLTSVLKSSRSGAYNGAEMCLIWALKWTTQAGEVDLTGPEVDFTGRWSGPHRALMKDLASSPAITFPKCARNARNTSERTGTTFGYKSEKQMLKETYTFGRVLGHLLCLVLVNTKQCRVSPSTSSRCPGIGGVGEAEASPLSPPRTIQYPPRDICALFAKRPKDKAKTSDLHRDRPTTHMNRPIGLMLK